MTAMEIVKFHPKHLEVAQVRQHEIDILLKLKDGYKKTEILADCSVQAATFIYDGRIIMCAGFMDMWEGVCELWQIPTVYVHLCPVLFAKTTRAYIESIAETFKYRRLQTASLADDVNDRWMTYLGFTQEGTMQQYTVTGQAYKMWARIFKWE